MNGGVAVGGIKDMPLPAGGLDKERQRRVAQHPKERHLAQGLCVVETITFGTIRTPQGKWLDQLWQIHRVHLTVSVHLDTDVDPLEESVAISCHHGPANPEVNVMSQQLHPRVARSA